MGRLTEREIFSCLTENFRLAAQCCDDLAKSPRKGPIYLQLREQLGLIEGSCRQAAYFREDARWLSIGIQMGEAHKRAGGWLRGYKVNGVHISVAPGHMHPLFLKLAENLRAAQKRAEEFRDKATKRRGVILPRAAEAPHRETRPVQVLLPAALQNRGLILPPGMTVQ